MCPPMLELRSTIENLQTLVGKIERRLQAGDSASDNERVRREAGMNLRVHR